MFRSSAAFARRQATLYDDSEAGAQKRSHDASECVSRSWDSSTGQYFDEDLPADIKELMGIAPKKAKTFESEKVVEDNAWKKDTVQQARSTIAAPKPAPATKGPNVGKVDTASPSVEFKGFYKVDLNDRYFEKKDLHLHGKLTYWTEDLQFFMYWQGELQRWALCDSGSFHAAKAGQYPGWAYKSDGNSFCEAIHWMEAWSGEWVEPSIEVLYRSSSKNAPQWDDPSMQKLVSTVEFHGLSMKELNTRYKFQSTEEINGKPTYWDESETYFIYWQMPTARWAICDKKCLVKAKAGETPGWAYRADSKHFANAAGWVEHRSGNWIPAIVETCVIGACAKGLKVLFSGFTKRELNTEFVETSDVMVQGKTTYWNSSSTFFIYWQKTAARWAIADKASMSEAQAGRTPGFAYRSDGSHFTRPRGWMEFSGVNWRKANASCKLLEGNVRDASSQVKSELLEEGALPAGKYKALIREIYQARNPAKLEDLPKLLEKYRNRENELYSNVCEKYDVDPDEFAAQAASLPEEEEEVNAYGVADAVGKEPRSLPQAKSTQPEEDACAELSSKDYAIFIQAIYELHNPKKLQDLGRLLQKYRNNERELYLLVCSRYGLDPQRFHAENLERLQ